MTTSRSGDSSVATLLQNDRGRTQKERGKGFIKAAKGSLVRSLFFLVWQPAHAVRFALRADPLLRSLLGIRSGSIFEAAA